MPQGRPNSQGCLTTPPRTKDAEHAQGIPSSRRAEGVTDRPFSVTLAVDSGVSEPAELLSRERVRAMVDSEQHCCAFLNFDVREQPDVVHVTITAPEHARDAADELFEQLTAADHVNQ